MPYEELFHTADVAILVTADDASELFTQATRAMFEIPYGEAWEGERLERTVSVADGDVESLLWEWLSVVLGWGEVDRAAYFDARVEVLPGRVTGTLSGLSIEGRELIGPPIKAVTMHELEVSENARGWSAVIVFDV